MTWDALVRRIRARTQLPNKTIDLLLEALRGELAEALARPDFERLMMPGIGTFTASWSSPRVVRSPSDQRRIFVDGRWRIAFRPTKTLRARVERQSPQLWREDAHQRAWRLAEALVSDLALYHPERRPAGVRTAIPDSAVRAAAEATYGPQWWRAVRAYEAEVPGDARAERDHLAEAVRARWSTRERTREPRRRRPDTTVNVNNGGETAKGETER